MKAYAAAITALAGMFLAQPVQAQGIDELPNVVRAEIRKADAACRRTGGRPGYEPLELVRAEDISADGTEDFFIDYSKYTCLGVGRTFCGSGGCSLQIFLSAGRNRWVKAFDELVFAFALAEAQGRTTATVETSGIQCGKPRSETCKQRLVGRGTAIQFGD